MSRVHEVVVCSPEDYQRMSNFIQGECVDVNNRWIYQIIDKQWHYLDEDVFLDTEHWVMVKNKYHASATDFRLLIIFKDKSLKTIRELRGKHVPLLKQISASVTHFMQCNNVEDFFMYFHYLPSVFQLHLHVHANSTYVQKISKQNDRIHPLHTVVHNLQCNSEHYAQALILTKSCKMRHRAEILEKKTDSI